MNEAGIRAAELADAAVAGDRRALARLLTAVENRTAIAEAALRRLYPSTGRAHLVGITGAPGAGKSTLVAALIAEVRAVGRAVAVVAVDPSSPITGGALLGDRVRMQAYASDDGVFIRSMASRGHAGGLAATSTSAATVLDAAGFDLVLLETVGTGQSEVEVAAAADTTVVLETPEMGDEVQAIKAGLLEVADIVVVNKGDRPGAQRTAAQLRAMLMSTASPRVAPHAHDELSGWHPDDLAHDEAAGAGLGEGDAVSAGHRAPSAGRDTAWAERDTKVAGNRAASAGSSDLPERPRPKQPDILITTASTGEGVPALLIALDRHRAAGRDGLADDARLARAEAQVWAIVSERLRARFHGAAAAPATEATLRAVAEHRLDPYTAADSLLATLTGG